MKQIRPALVLFGLLTVLTGVLYPFGITGLAQLVFPYQANGSLIRQDGVVIGSALIGQQFSQAGYFWGRPSATANFPYNAAASGGSNLGPINPELDKLVKERITALQAADPGNLDPIPVDLVTASASGLDPDISVAAARYQAGRIAAARGIGKADVLSLIDEFHTPPFLGLVGEARINVLQLNQTLDRLK
jgi:K+-transporting ATPase ATPase C chain